MGDWNSEKYLLFKYERTQPAIDLVNRINMDNPKKIIDIGCGPGNSTEVLSKKFPNAYIIGVDSSTNMIDTAKKTYPNINFMTLDASCELDKLPKDFDVVFSNACIQWIPNHNKLITNIMGLLKEGGVLAVQTPMNYEEPIHKIIGEVSKNKKWESEFNDTRNFYNLTQGEYFDLIADLSDQVSLWETVYYHILNSHNDIMEWYKGTGLRPYLDALSEEKKVDFEREVYSRVVEAYPKQRSGKIIFRFPRLFFTCIK